MPFRRIPMLLLTFLIAPGWQMVFGQPKVVVSIPPQKAFVQAIAGEAVEVVVMVKPGHNPASFSMTPQRLAELSKATLYLTIGVPMEASLLARLRANYPDMQIVDTTAGIRKRSLVAHSHNHEDEAIGHAHPKDPHTWLSPGLVKIQLRHTLRALQELLPMDSATFDRNYQSFVGKLEEVDEQLKGKLNDLRGSTVFVYHPAFGYFLDRYGLRQETVELKGKQPTPKQLGILIKLAKQLETKTIFVQPQFDRQSAQTLAQAIQATVESIDPLAENYLDNLLHMGETIAKSHQ